MGRFEYYLIATAAVAVLALLSWKANRSFAAYDRLPMQWSFSGKVVWSAPRRWALSFTPLLAAVLLFGSAALHGPGELKSQPHGIGAYIVMALTFIGVHLVHLYLINRNVGRR